MKVAALVLLSLTGCDLVKPGTGSRTSPFVSHLSKGGYARSCPYSGAVVGNTAFVTGVKPYPAENLDNDVLVVGRGNVFSRIGEPTGNSEQANRLKSANFSSIQTLTLDREGMADDAPGVHQMAWGNLPVPHEKALVGLGSYENLLFVAGGIDESTNITTDHVGIYDVESENWSEGKLSAPRSSVMVASGGGRVFFVGGANSVVDGGTLCQSGVCYFLSDFVDVYDVASASWSSTRMHFPRYLPGVAVIGERLFVWSGWANSDISLDAMGARTLEIFDPATGSWQWREFPFLGSVIDRHQDYEITAVGRKIFLVGNPDARSAVVYDTDRDQWSVLRMPHEHLHGTVVALGNRLVVAGGNPLEESGESNAWVDVYDDATGEWSSGTLRNPGRAHMAIGFGNRFVAIVKGTVDLFDALTAEWSRP